MGVDRVGCELPDVWNPGLYRDFFERLGATPGYPPPFTDIPPGVAEAITRSSQLTRQYTSRVPGRLHRGRLTRPPAIANGLARGLSKVSAEPRHRPLPETKGP